MSLLIDQLAAYLQTQGQGTVGTTIFKAKRPPSPVACVTIYATGGYPPDRYNSREHPTLQIVARAATPQASLQKAYAVYALLHNKQHLNLGSGIFALTIQAIQSPASIGEETAANATAHLASLNILCDLRRPSS